MEPLTTAALDEWARLLRESAVDVRVEASEGYSFTSASSSEHS